MIQKILSHLRKIKLIILKIRTLNTLNRYVFPSVISYSIYSSLHFWRIFFPFSVQSTAVLLYKPQALDKVLSCSLNSMEAFSCCLMAEDDTALSIIDPMTISIELNANPLPEFKSTSTSASLGLLAVPETQLRQLLLEVKMLSHLLLKVKRL